MISPFILLPVLLLTLLVYFRKFKADNASNSESISLSDIDNMSDFRLNAFLYYFFSKKGYQVKMIRDFNDKPEEVALILKDTSEDEDAVEDGKEDVFETIVITKLYDDTLNEEIVIEAMLAQEDYDCQEAMIITNSYFISSAQELAANKGIKLWNRNDLSQEVEANPVQFKELPGSWRTVRH
ncbi:restriction endonuclease [Fuchsiella alkaliacetigena]|nr:restriction endonuclease [Fuchsiella alkaliacetigena]